MNTFPSSEAILEQIARIQCMEKGTLSTIRQTADGPCCNFQRWEGQRHSSEYIPALQVPKVRENLQAHTQFEALVAQYVQLVSARTRQERLAGVQKKRQMPNSSSPKKRKSNS